MFTHGFLFVSIHQFGATDTLKGHVPVALMVLKNDLARSEDEVRP